MSERTQPRVTLHTGGRENTLVINLSGDHLIMLLSLIGTGASAEPRTAVGPNATVQDVETWIECSADLVKAFRPLAEEITAP